MELRDLDKANDLRSSLDVLRALIDAWGKQKPSGPSTIGLSLGPGRSATDVQVVDAKAWLAMRAASVKLLEEQYERAAAELAAL